MTDKYIDYNVPVEGGFYGQWNTYGVSLGFNWDTMSISFGVFQTISTGPATQIMSNMNVDLDDFEINFSNDFPVGVGVPIGAPTVVTGTALHSPITGKTYLNAGLTLSTDLEERGVYLVTQKESRKIGREWDPSNTAGFDDDGGYPFGLHESNDYPSHSRNGNNDSSDRWGGDRHGPHASGQQSGGIDAAVREALNSNNGGGRPGNLSPGHNGGSNSVPSSWQDHPVHQNNRGGSSWGGGDRGDPKTSSGGGSNSSGGSGGGWTQTGGNEGATRGGSGGDGLRGGGRSSDWDNHPVHGHPVVIDMDGDGIELKRLSGSTTDFDFDDDGYLERTAWTTGDDALLMFDLGNDGKVTEAKEIAFAEWTEEDDTDLEALATHFDTNQDKVLDNRDEGWASFKLWQDKNSDGVVDDGEMVALDEAGIKSIGLERREGTEQVLDDGTVIHGLVDVQKADGSITDGADVAFAYNALGFRSYEDDNGNVVYEFEDGEVQKIKKLGEEEVDFHLGNHETVWIGAEGNALANVIDASEKTDSVLLNGGASDDTLIGGAGSDFLIGGEGTDSLKGGAGHDILFVDGDDLTNPEGIDGGEGFDQIILTDNTALDLDVDEMNVEAVRAAGGDDSLTGAKDDINYAFAGGAGNDTLTGGGGHDLLSGEEGDDKLVGRGGQDRLFGEGGDDVLEGGDGDDLIAGGSGNDTLKGGAGNDIYYYNRGDGDDTLHDYATDDETEPQAQEAYQYSHDRVQSGANNRVRVDETRTGYTDEAPSDKKDGGIDTLQFGVGIALSDLVLSRSGDDMVVALRDKDDADVISDDRITITDWADQRSRLENFAFIDGTKLDFSRIINGQYGLGEDDVLTGTAEGDFLSGGKGNDQLKGGEGRDIITGGEGDDRLDGGADKDFLFADGGDDTLIGQDGDDYLIAGSGHDLLQGGDGNDALAGQDGDDRLEGGAGDDIFLGGTGTDYLKGGEGDDTYIYFRGDGHDTIEETSEITEVQNVESIAYTAAYNGGWSHSKGSRYDIWRHTTYYRLSYKDKVTSSYEDVSQDTVQFGYSIDLDDLVFDILDDHLEIAVTDGSIAYADYDVLSSTDRLTITNWDERTSRIETLVFSDGYELDIGDIESVYRGTDEIENYQYTGEQGGVFAFGYGGDDHLTGGDERDILKGDEGDDHLEGHGGRDTLFGGDGDDRLEGGADDDDLFGNEGDDTLLGGEGDDYLFGHEGQDTLEGGEGDDVLIGGSGNDTLKGGDGNDRYVFFRGDGHDTIEEAPSHIIQEYFIASAVRKTGRYLRGTGDNADWININKTSYVRDYRTFHDGNKDVLEFGYAIDVSDLVLSYDEGDLVIGIKPLHDSGDGDIETAAATSTFDDQITIKNWDDKGGHVIQAGNVVIEGRYAPGTITAGNSHVELLEFANGMKLSIGDLYGFVRADDSNVAVTADTATATWLSGDENANVLTGSNQNDILLGGQGDDRLEGGAGDDVYIFNRGDGRDTIDDSGSRSVGRDPYAPKGDKLLFGEGITIEDVILKREGDDLVIYVRDQDNPDTPLSELSDYIRIEDWASARHRVEVLEFSGGMNFDISDITNTYLGQDLTDRDVTMAEGFSRLNDAEHVSRDFSFWGYDDPTGVHWRNQNEYSRQLADVNGDGLADIVGFDHYTGVYVALSNGDGTFADAEHVSGDFSANSRNESTGRYWFNQDEYSRQLADVNGDGAADIIGFDRHTGVYVALSNGDGTFADAEHVSRDFSFWSHDDPTGVHWRDQDEYSRQLADVNGDGSADIVGFDSHTGVYVALSNGDGTFADAEHVSGDFSANSRDEATGRSWRDQDQYSRQLADVNGDGAADIIGFDRHTGVYVALSNGDGTFADAEHVSRDFGAWYGGASGQRWLNQDKHSRQLADVNGDGSADIVGFDSHTGVYVALSNGDGTFADAEHVSGDFSYYGYRGEATGRSWRDQDQYSRQLADVNGDGSADIVGFDHYTGVYTATFEKFGSTYDEASNTFDDKMSGSDQGDWMDGFAGNDTLSGNEGDDFLFGREGNDTLDGGDGADTLSGDGGDDRLSGGQGDDIMASGTGNDELLGNEGDDILMGGDGDDTFDGGDGDDVIVGDRGNDTYTASHGKDVYRFGYGDGQDTYKGSSKSWGDSFIMDDGIKKEALWFEQEDNDLVVSLLGSEDKITFEDWYQDSNTDNYINRFYIEDAFLYFHRIDNLVSVMADYEPNDGTTAYGVTDFELPESIQIAINDAWSIA